MKRYIHFILFTLILACPLLHAETGVSGIVVDAETGEVLPFVQIYFIDPNSTDGKVQTSIGTTSDMEGQFRLTNNDEYNTINFQMIGYKTEMLTVKRGTVKADAKIKMRPDVYGLQDIVVTPKHRKRDYKRRGNPAVELINNVIARKDSFTVHEKETYIADSYARMSFALDNFYPNFNKGIWKTFNFIEKYIDTTSTYPSMTISIREHLNKEYYQRKPHREKMVIEKKRIFGVEDVIGSGVFQENVNAIFKEVNLNDDNMNLLFNRFVSPLNGSIGNSFYQYFIMDTLMVDGYQCIDLAFVPVNSESYGFTGHLYIVNDSTYKLKRYAINIPPNINLNFVSNFSIEADYKQLDNGKWAPDRTTTFAKFYIFSNKRGILARQTKIYTNWDFDTPIASKTFSRMSGDAFGDSATVRVPSAYWDTLRPEPLTRYEYSVSDLVKEFEANPTFNTLALVVNSLSTGFIPTTPVELKDSSYFDLGPIFSTVSWNALEGTRFRVGGTTTPHLSQKFYLQTYVAAGCGDKRPKGNVTGIFSFNQHKWHLYDNLVHQIKISAQYDVEEPGKSTETFIRDNIFSSIPSGKPSLPMAMYTARAGIEWEKEWKNHFLLRVGFNYSNVEAAGALNFDRIHYNDDFGYYTQRFNRYHNYEGLIEMRYSPGFYVHRDRMGIESTNLMEQDAPIFRANHTIGFLDDRGSGGRGFFYNKTELSLEKRFWFSAFGYLDMRVMTGAVWQKVPFTKLFTPNSSTGIFLTQKGFNQMQPMEFLFDAYVSLFATYYFKGWILNRIPGINRLKLRGVVSVAAIYGGVTDKNNPYKSSGEGLYLFPNNARYDQDNRYIGGYCSSPIGKLPYVEVTAGLENIFKVLRVDYVRRITYNDYVLPDGIHHKKMGAWGRNGVKITLKLSL